MFIAHFCLDNEWYWLNRKPRASPRLCPDIFALGRRREVLMKDEREAEARAAEQSRWRVKADLIEPGGPPGRPTATAIEHRGHPERSMADGPVLTPSLVPPSADHA